MTLSMVRRRPVSHSGSANWSNRPTGWMRSEQTCALAVNGADNELEKVQTGCNLGLFLLPRPDDDRVRAVPRVDTWCIDMQLSGDL